MRNIEYFQVRNNLLAIYIANYYKLRPRGILSNFRHNRCYAVCMVSPYGRNSVSKTRV